MEIKAVKPLHSTDWLSFRQASCRNDQGQEFKWDYIARKNGQNVVSIICHSADSQKILLIREFRAPMNQWVIEFPKGLIKKNETIEAASLRELKEETGYTGRVLRVSPFLATCAYLTNEMNAIVEIEADETRIWDTDCEKAEEIVPFWIEKKNFKNEVREFQKNNYAITE